MPDFKCPLLTNIESKTENECQEEDAKAKELFKIIQFKQRMLLPAEKYFKELPTVAFQKVDF